jgi:copper chaperone CopZ
MTELQFKIQGFHCEACIKLSTMKIKKINGVEHVSIQADGSAAITATRPVTTEEVSAALDGLGYTVITA